MPCCAATDYDPGVVYGTQLMDEDYIRPRDGTGRLENRADYRAHPEKYRSVFHDEVRAARRRRGRLGGRRQRVLSMHVGGSFGRCLARSRRLSRRW